MRSEANPKNRVVIAGGTGFLGLNLASHLTEKGHDVVLISRNAPHQDGPWLHAKWNGRSVGDWAGHLEGAAALVNLAGRTVDCKPCAIGAYSCIVSSASAVRLNAGNDDALLN